MSKGKIVVSSGGMGLLTFLTIILVILKLIGVINISWLWCFAPLIIGFVIAVSFIVIASVVLLLLGIAALRR